MYVILPQNALFFAIIPMKSYDDLQRFKEKTQTNHIEFRDMSDQTRSSDSANWPIIRQLMDDSPESTFGQAQSLHIAPPQPVADDAFCQQVASRIVPEKQPRTGPALPQNVTASVTERPVGQGDESLLHSISAQLNPANHPLSSADTPETVGDCAPAKPQSVEIVEAPVTTASGGLPRFKQLFHSVPEPHDSPLPKDTQLHDLLERIASCR